MRLIDADAIITALIYDEEHEETQEIKMSIADFLDSHTVEGCPQNGGWISVKDRMPDKEGRYLVSAIESMQFTHVTVVRFCRHFILTGHRAYWKITHWMPLPEPPKGE